MAKLNYLEVVEMLGTSVSSTMQKKIDHVVARKKALKENLAYLPVSGHYL